jgi:hypothetical protein
VERGFRCSVGDGCNELTTAAGEGDLRFFDEGRGVDFLPLTARDYSAGLEAFKVQNTGSA